jgi:hypothetical protein
MGGAARDRETTGPFAAAARARRSGCPAPKAVAAEEGLQHEFKAG